MKKLLSLLLCVTLIAGSGALSGCANDRQNESNLSGTEIAKLLLANTRLDTNDLSVGLKDSVTVADVSVLANNVALVASGEGISMPSSTTTSGNTVSWSDFSNECNTYDFFKSYFDTVEAEAEMFAEIIDTAKKDCGITGYWVRCDRGQVLLQVEANQETIYLKTDYGYSVCRRYTDENADDVYEMYRNQNNGATEMRMLYIAGKRYEFSLKGGGMEGMYIVAENTRGYWNMFQVTDIAKNRCNIMNFVSTGDMAFTFDLSMAEDLIYTGDYTLSFSAADLSNDIVSIGDGYMDMNLGAFNGIDRVEAPSSDVSASEGCNTLVSGQGTLITTSGKRMECFHEEDDGTRVISITASYTSDFYGPGKHRTSGRVMLNVQGDTAAQQMDAFKAFLEEYDLSCKYNLDAVVSKYAAAQEIAKTFNDTYRWNGYSVEDYTGIEGAVKVEKDTWAEFAAMYDRVKDIRTVETTSFGHSFEGWDFSKIDSISCGNVTLNEDQISVENMSVSIKDTAIFDKDQKYTVYLALAKFVNGSEADYENAVIMSHDGVDTIGYDGASSITLNQTATFTLPRCAAEGKYTVVAYVGTEEGIRVSEMIPVLFSEDIEKTEHYDGFKIDYKAEAGKEIRIESAIDLVVYIKPEDVKTEYTYEEMYALLKEGVVKNGYFVEGAAVEIYDSSTGAATPVEPGQKLTAGTYRMAYSKPIGDTEQNGYVYFDFQ